MMIGTRARDAKAAPMKPIVARMHRRPICNVAGKPENLSRGLNDNRPRHPDRPGRLEKLKEDPGRIRKRQAGRPFRVRWWQVALVVSIFLGGVGAVALPPLLSGEQALPCIRQEGGLLYHWHSDLSISSAAGSVSIPAGIGIGAFCLQPLHTPDPPGRIHIQSHTPRPYPIG